MTFYAMYPPAGSSANASIGTNGATAPTSSTEVGGINPSGNLQPLQTDSSGNLLVSIGTEPATPLNTNIADYGGVATSLGQKAMAASIPVVIASDQSTLPVSAASLPLPTGAATSANQTTEITTLTAIEANQTNGAQVTTISGTVPLPTGASTAALQSNVQSAPGTSQTVAITVQGNASGIAVPISGTVTTSGTVTAKIEDTSGNALNSNGSGALKVDGSAVTQPVSASSLPLPTGASTAANQTNVQSAIGTSATTAITVQGAASGVDLPVAIASSITIPISGVVIADIKDSAGNTLSSNGSGALQVAGTGVAGTPNAGVMSIQGVSGGTAVTISGTVTTSGTTAVTQSTSPWVDNITQFGGTNISTGTGASGAGIPRVTVSNDSNILATQSGTWNITNVSGTISLPTGASTSALQSSVQGSATGGTAATSSQLAGGIYNSTPPTLTNGQQAALQFTSAGALVTSATSTTITSSTSTLTSVAAATSSTSLLASNTGRKGAYFFNDSTAILYLAFASSASTTAYTVQIASNGFYEMPNPAVYTGSIFGIWSAANGNVRITELS
jgi:hypothetical protein